MRTTLVAILLLTVSARGGDREVDPVTLFRARARVTDPGSGDDVARLRDDLLAHGDGAWSGGRLRSDAGGQGAWVEERVRSALARSLTDAQVARAIHVAAEDAEEPSERLGTLVRNLRGRPGLGGALLAADALDVAVQSSTQELAELAAVELLDDDHRLARALLSRPAGARRVAQDLADSRYANGLCFVADVVTGAVSVPDAARGALAGFDVNLGAVRDVRPLGPERRAALVRVAREDPDPALRVVAARILHYAATPESLGPAYAATGAARSHRIGNDEWDWLGRDGPPPIDAALLPSQRIRAIRGWVYLSHERAYGDPLSTEWMAARLLELLAAVDAPRTRGALDRALAELAYCFADANPGRPRIAPSFEALLTAWETGRDGDPPSLRALERRLAADLRRELVWGDAPDEIPPLLLPESPALAAMPEEPPSPGAEAATVAAWWDSDPQHLHDARVRQRLLTWDLEARRRVLAAYPEESLREMLTTPPTRGLAPRKGLPVHDPSGSAGRRPLLELLVDDPRHAARLRDPALWRGWPDRDRRLAGALLHRLAPADGEARDALADDAFATGFVEAAFTSPSGPDDAGLRLAAAVTAGVVTRPALRWALVDGDPGEDDPSVSCGLRLEEDVVEGLVRVLAEDADPQAGCVAARLLVATGGADAYAQVLAHDEWLQCADFWGSSSRPEDVARLVRDDGTRDAVLLYVAADGGLPGGRVDAFAALAELSWVAEIHGEDAAEEVLAAREERELQHLGRWLVETLPSLDPDVAEGVAEAWWSMPDADHLTFARQDEVRAWAVATLRRAVEGLPDGPVRRRLLAR